MPYLVAGDPDFTTSLKICRKISKYGDLLEIGFPFSDPIADGPVIQEANQRALDAGMTTDRVFQFLKAVRKFTNAPITILVYANLVLQKGLNKFYKTAKQCGVDAILIPDLPLEETRTFVLAARKYNLDQIFLVTQTTRPKRLKQILKHARGYLYLVSILGITGKRKTISRKTFELIRSVRKKTVLPLAVGFGISRRNHLRHLARSEADGVIVGSALIEIIAKSLRGKLLLEIEKYVIQLIRKNKR